MSRGEKHYNEYYNGDRGQRMFQDADYTLTSTTNAQKAFSPTGATGGAFNARAGARYRFRCELTLTALDSASGNVAFGFGGTATVTFARWQTVGIKAAAGAGSTSATNSGHCNSTTITPIAATAANTGTSAAITAWGVLQINAAGTLIPQVALGVAAAAVMETGSVFEIWDDPSLVTDGDFA